VSHSVVIFVSNALGVNLRRVGPEISASCALSDSITTVTEYALPVSEGFIFSIATHPLDCLAFPHILWQVEGRTNAFLSRFYAGFFSIYSILLNWNCFCT